jgi:diaminopimelate epimerase
MSGARENLPVRVNVEEGRAAVEVPGPLAAETFDFEGRSLPVYVFEGITHIIAPDIPPGEKIFSQNRGGIGEKFARQPPAALGVLFYDTAAAFMRPAVYVYGTDSLVFESSCGSGSAALAVWKTESGGDGEAAWAVKQPGGTIEAQVRRRDGRIRGISIGGRVELSGRMYR